jgi:Arc/MetJ-type ribon-helix-helix transcriptional regulator
MTVLSVVGVAMTRESRYNIPSGEQPMTMTVTLKDEAAEIVQRQLSEGRYPDAETAITAALMLLEDAAIDWGDVDATSVRRMIAESDAEGGEIPFDDRE